MSELFEGDRAGCESMKKRMALAILLQLDPGAAPARPAEKKRIKNQ